MYLTLKVRLEEMWRLDEAGGDMSVLVPNACAALHFECLDLVLLHAPIAQAGYLRGTLSVPATSPDGDTLWWKEWNRLEQLYE